MSDAVRLLDESGAPIQEGNPVPIDASVDSNLIKELEKINDEGLSPIQFLKSIDVSMKIMVLHLAKLSGRKFTKDSL